MLLGIPVNPALICFVFFATICSYNLHFLLGAVFAGRSFSLRLLFNRYSSVFFLLLGAVGAMLVYSSINISFASVAISVLLTLLYSVPLLPFHQLAFTRRAGFLKTSLLAFTWTYVTAFLPMLQFGLQFTSLGLVLLVKRFCFMLMLCILFDNRDAAIDKIRGLSSLATDLSPQLMKWLIYGLFIALFVLNFVLGTLGITLAQRIALQLASFATLVVYFYSTKKQGYLFYYFVVDGLMFLSALLVTIASI